MGKHPKTLSPLVCSAAAVFRSVTTATPLHQASLRQMLFKHALGPVVAFISHTHALAAPDREMSAVHHHQHRGDGTLITYMQNSGVIRMVRV